MRDLRDLSACPACSGPLAADQRYCLGCGIRVAPHRVPPPGAAKAVTAATVIESRRLFAPRPHPRTAAALVLATLGAGVIAGGTASAGGDSPARPLYAMAPPAAATPTAAPEPAASTLPDDDGRARVRPAPAAPHGAEPKPAAGAPPPAASAAVPAPAAEPSEPAPEPTPEPAPEPVAAPPYKHVVVVSLTGQDAAAFAEGTPATYLAGELAPQGTLVTAYEPVAPGSLADGLALLAGAKPTDATRQDCPRETGTQPGEACLLAKGAASIPGALSDAARSWKTYVAGEPTPCSTEPVAGYDPARNPLAFMRLQDCATSQGALDGLAEDFTDTDLAPALAYVVPDACHDGSAADCPETPGTPLERADAWLRETIPPLLASEAFADDGLLIVLFDGGGLPAPADGAVPARTGALLVSGKLAAGATVEDEVDTYDLARVIADGLGVAAPGAAKGRRARSLTDALSSQDVPNSDTTG